VKILDVDVDVNVNVYCEFDEDKKNGMKKWLSYVVNDLNFHIPFSTSWPTCLGC
jgi:hypothetical protein